tara:strand:+ start:1697 stop:1945 length:249 start_codon:yes stop_codon:yes gene_type:complete
MDYPLIKMTAEQYQNQMVRISVLIANLSMLADKIGRQLDINHLHSISEEELKQMQDNLIEQYNASFKQSPQERAPKSDPSYK